MRFIFRDDRYEVDDDGGSVYVNGRKCRQYVLRHITGSGREFAGRIYVPVGKGVKQHAIEYLSLPASDHDH